MQCNNCGASYADEASYCQVCGCPNPAAGNNQGAGLNQTMPNPEYQCQQPVNSASNGISVAALVCGILGIIGAWIPVVCYFTLVLAILGIAFGVSGMKNARVNGGQGKGLATAGLVCGIIGTAFSAAGAICALACVGSAASYGLSGLL